MNSISLPLPSLSSSLGLAGDSLNIITDEALFESCGVRIGFSSRLGGVSVGPFASLNVGLNTDDDWEKVQQNRALLAQSLGYGIENVVSPKQVHEDTVEVIDTKTNIQEFRSMVENGCDAIICARPDFIPLLCFADCVPVVVVSPSGLFAVVHAGWRGVAASIVVKTIRMMLEQKAEVDFNPSDYNVYIGPHIHECCFEVSKELKGTFVEKFGKTCALDDTHVSLLEALKVDLLYLGVSKKRIVDAGICTNCQNEHYFSYRAANGICGRHGAFGIKPSSVS